MHQNHRTVLHNAVHGPCKCWICEVVIVVLVKKNAQVNCLTSGTCFKKPCWVHHHRIIIYLLFVYGFIQIRSICLFVSLSIVVLHEYMDACMLHTIWQYIAYADRTVIQFCHAARLLCHETARVQLIDVNCDELHMRCMRWRAHSLRSSFFSWADRCFPPREFDSSILATGCGLRNMKEPSRHQRRSIINYDI